MTQEQRDAWCKALRSGEYQQAHRMLRVHDTYCAVGVLCDITDPSEWRLVEGSSRVFQWKNFRAYPDASGLGPYDARVIAAQNDIDCKSFTEIADWIEQNVEVTP